MNPNILEERWLFWLAGLIEGEGCITLTKHKGGYRHAEVFINMTDGDVVKRAQAVIGGGDVMYFPKKKKANHKPTWRLRVGGNRAVDLIRVLLPIMGERRTRRMLEVLEIHEADRKRGIKSRSESMVRTNARLRILRGKSLPLYDSAARASGREGASILPI